MTDELPHPPIYAKAPGRKTHGIDHAHPPKHYGRGHRAVHVLMPGPPPPPPPPGDELPPQPPK